MASKKNRKRQVRRDRRKAKASNWKRAGKVKWGKVGHGSGTFIRGCATPKAKTPKAPIPEDRVELATVCIGDLWPTDSRVKTNSALYESHEF